MAKLKVNSEKELLRLEGQLTRKAHKLRDEGDRLGAELVFEQRGKVSDKIVELRAARDGYVVASGTHVPSDLDEYTEALHQARADGDEVVVRKLNAARNEYADDRWGGSKELVKGSW